jgi:hypothetical protein
MVRLIALGLVLVPQLTAPTAVQHYCRITVVDPVEAPIAGARILVSPNSASQSVSSARFMQTDGNGHLTAPVPEGILDVCVVSPNFAPSCKQAEIKGKDVELRFKLDLSKFAKMVE